MSFMCPRTGMRTMFFAGQFVTTHVPFSLDFDVSICVCCCVRCAHHMQHIGFVQQQSLHDVLVPRHHRVQQWRDLMAEGVGSVEAFVRGGQQQQARGQGLCLLSQKSRRWLRVRSLTPT